MPAIAQLACFAYALARRAVFPMDLEWMESTQLYAAYRMAHGLPVYGPPSQGFVPSAYAPFFAYLTSLVGRAFGFDYWNGRVLSDAAIVGVVAVQASVVFRAAPSRRTGYALALMCAGCVAASYRWLQGSMDLARVDMVGVAEVFVCAWLCQRRPLGPARAMLLGALLCAAVFTKQTNIYYAIWLLGVLAWRDRRAAVLAGTVAASLSLWALAELQRATHGWFWTWMVSLRHLDLAPWRCVFFAVFLPVALFAWGAVLLALRRRGWLREPTWFWCGMLAASIPASIHPMLAVSVWINVLIGLVMLAILVVMLMVCDALVGLRSEGVERWTLAAFSVFLLGALYDPNAKIPDARSARDVEALHALVRSLDGDVLAPMYPFVAARDGVATPQIGMLGYFDTLGPGRINADAHAVVRATHPEWVILFGQSPQEDELRSWLSPGYVEIPTGLHVQALQESTHGVVTLMHRASSDSRKKPASAGPESSE